MNETTSSESDIPGGYETAASRDGRKLVTAAFFDIGFITLATIIMTLALASANIVNLLSQSDVGGISKTAVMVTSIPTYANGLEYGLNTKSISSEDITALSSPGAIPAASFVAPVSLSTRVVSYTYRSDNTVEIKTTPAYLPASGYKLKLGSFLSYANVSLNQDVVVIGSSVEKGLFGTSDPIGQSVSIGGGSYKVIGTLATRGFASALDLDNVIIVPLNSASSVTSSFSGVSQVLIGTRSPALAQQAAQQAQAELLSLNQITDPAQANFTILTHDSFVGSQLAELKTLKRSLTFFALLIC